MSRFELACLTYLHGFRMGLLLPMAGYLALVVYQGNFRFRLLIPIILLVACCFFL